MILIIFLTTVALTLAAGFYLFYTLCERACLWKILY
jgi:hypothetical protein